MKKMILTFFLLLALAVSTETASAQWLFEEEFFEAPPHHTFQTTTQEFQTTTQPATADSVTVDVLVAVSNQRALVGMATLSLYHQQVVESLNQALVTSGVVHRIRLVGTVFLDIDESDCTSNKVKVKNYPNIDDIRHIYGADVILLAVQTSAASCAPIGPSPASFVGVFAGAEHTSFPSLSFSHEFCHLAGCRHEIEIDPNGGSEHGFWWVENGGGRDIMSYGGECGAEGCPPLNIFSNPEVEINGVQIGIPGIADVATHLNENLPILASFMEEVSLPADPVVWLGENGRFSVAVSWQTEDGTTGQASLVPGNSQDSAILWFFEPGNWEMMVKTIDACGYNGHFWVFFSATTNVAYTMTVTDTFTGVSKEYSNPLGNPAQPVQDTSAFPCG
jgi:hypothetical protein